MKRNVTILLIIGLVILIIAGCGSPQTPEPTPTPTPHPGKTIVASRCIGCHPLNRLENSAFNEVGWQLVVDRMLMSGAQLNDEQVVLAVDYLVQTYPYPEE